MFKLEELTKMTAKELNQEFIKATKDLFKIRFEVNTGSSKAHHQIRKLRKYRATIKTIERQLQSEEKTKFESQKAIEDPKAEKVEK
jgi:ribosomal protein L29